MRKRGEIIMKKKYAKMLVYGLVTVMLVSTLSGCSGCKDKTEENVTSEIVSEETTEELTEDVSEEVSETVSEETSAETSEEVSEEVSEETTEEVSEETSVETSETPSEEVSEEPAYTVEPMSATMYAQRSVNVRKGPGTEYDRVGSLTTNQEVAVTGKASTGWYEISYNGEVAYVSNNYLGNEKVVVQPTPAPTTPSTPETTTPATPDAGTGGSASTSETTYSVYLEPGMLDLVNGLRSQNGLPACSWDSGAEQVALDRAKAISSNFSHQG
ncbi:MAG: SH3 domain-containing protein, partial [Lachnospiraceae bacterium]|nr:SH3 domain-containing protein [Lachnospiraceae bacterium]